MNATILEQRHQLEMLLLRLERQTEENESALRQAKFDLREAKAAEVEYGGCFRAFRDKLTGKKEAAETALRHDVQKAEAALASATQTARRLALQAGEVHSQLDKLPTRAELKAQAEGEALSLWHRLDALYCVAALLPLLETNRILLTERRNQFNGSNLGVKSHQALSEIYSAPEAAGEACKPYIQRLKAALDALDIPFPVHDYWENPTAFLSSATQYTRMDRINTALAQVEAMEKRLPKLQKQLEE